LQLANVQLQLARLAIQLADLLHDLCYLILVVLLPQFFLVDFSFQVLPDLIEPLLLDFQSALSLRHAHARGGHPELGLLVQLRSDLRVLGNHL